MRLIDADAADVKTVPCFIKGNVCTVNVRKWLDEQPTVDAEPVRHAEWIPCVINGKETKLFMTCSGCKRYQWPRCEVPPFRRCPKCGAIMDGGSKRD